MHKMGQLKKAEIKRANAGLAAFTLYLHRIKPVETMTKNVTFPPHTSTVSVPKNKIEAGRSNTYVTLIGQCKISIPIIKR